MSRAVAVVAAGLLLLASLVYTAEAQMSSPKEQGGGLSWPLTATDYLDMNGNEIRTDGQLTFTDAGATQGFTLQIGADVMELLDQAGTGAADFALLANGELQFNGAGSNTFIDGSSNFIDFTAAGSRNFRVGSSVNTFYADSRHQRLSAHVDIELWRNDGTPTAGDKIADINFRAFSDTPALLDWGGIRAYQDDPTGGAEDLRLEFDVIDDGSEVTYLSLDASDGSEGVYASAKLYANAGMVNNVGAALPATCAQGEQFHDTDSNDCADTGGGDGAVCVCKTTNTWALVVDI